MEDTKRLRTKLRLDLNDVQRQIEDLDDKLDSDSSPEIVEQQKKLINYQKKLKDQYEKMTGMSLDQATSLTERPRAKVTGAKEGLITKLFGFLAGLLIFNGFYNITLHAIEGFNPTDLIDYYSGTGKSEGSLVDLAASLTYEGSQLLIIIPIAASIGLLVLSALFSKTGKFAKLFQAIGISAPLGYFLALTLLPNTANAVATTYEQNTFNFAFIFIGGGILILFALFDEEGLNRLFTLLTGVMFIYSGIQFLLVALDTGETATQLLYDWPWIMLPNMIAGLLLAIISLRR